jgi:hypothetical protein
MTGPEGCCPYRTRLEEAWMKSQGKNLLQRFSIPILFAFLYNRFQHAGQVGEVQ